MNIIDYLQGSINECNKIIESGNDKNGDFKVRKQAFEELLLLIQKGFIIK